MFRYLALFILAVLFLSSCATHKSTEEQKDKDIIRTESGLEYKEIKIGTGSVPDDGNRVKINLKIYDQNNNLIEDSKSSKPLEFVIGKEEVVTGLEEGVKTMKTGGKRILYIPPELGFGSRSMKNIPSDSFLIMEVELLDVK